MNIEQTIVQTTEPVRKFQENFKHFTTNVIMVIIACAVCIGFATKDMISSIMNDSILPIVGYFVEHSLVYLLYTKALEVSKHSEVINLLMNKIALLIWTILIWVLTLYLTYIVFRLITRVDILSDKVKLIQGISKYVLGENTNGEYVRSE